MTRTRICKCLLPLLLILLLCCATPAMAAYHTLEFGSRGTEVLKLQKALVSLGFDPNGTDGKYGRGTESAVLAYQSSKGLEADGKAGNQTLTALYADQTAGGTAGTSNATSNSSTAVSSSTLKYGDSGSSVSSLQSALTALGYNTNGVDGQFGAGTQRAVLAFQKAHNLKADGLAGTQTQALLYSKANGASSDTSNSSSSSNSGASNTSTGLIRTLRKGYTGDDVLQVQQKLKELGYYSGVLDGVYGTGSMASVKAFQQNNRLTADGLAGTQTFNALFSSSAIAAGSNSSSGDTSTGTGTSVSGTYITLRVGSTGTEVRSLQQTLKNLNYNVGVDGTYGDGTAQAVAAFQKRNSLTADGVAGALTQARLYSSSAIGADTSSSNSSDTGSSSTPSTDSNAGSSSGPATSSVKLLHWFNEVKPSIRSGQSVTVFDPASNLQWTLYLYSLGRHADSEPKTQADTDIMNRAFGTTTWTPKPVNVQLPSGVWTLASMHNTPHLTGSIKDNGFDGHLCVHFLRDMDECKANDPNYGVNNQNIIRSKWKQMTGETVE